MRLTALEQFFLLDHQPSHPNQIICRLRFSKKLDRKAFEVACHAIAQRHPMIMVNAQRDGRRFSWHHDPNRKIAMRWFEFEEDGPDFPTIPNVHPIEGKATCITGVQRPASSEVLLQTHHSCIDGLGGMQVVSDWMIAYANSLAQSNGDDQKQIKQRRLRSELLTERGRFYDSWSSALRNLPYQLIGMLGAIKYLSRRSTPLLGKTESLTDAQASSGKASIGTKGETSKITNSLVSDTTPSAVTRSLSPEESDWLRTAAQQRNVTVNAVLTRELFLAIEDWREQQDCTPGPGITRIMIPINMRSIADRRLSAANRVAMTYLDRSKKALRKPAELLWGINYEIRTIQKLNLGVTCLGLISLLRSIPGLMRREVNAKVCRSTCIFTNLGEPFGRLPLPKKDGKLQVGPMELVGFDLLAPIRPLTACSISIFRYQNRLQLTMHYDSQAIDQRRADLLLEKVLNRARETAKRGQRQQQAAEHASQTTSTHED